MKLKWLESSLHMAMALPVDEDIPFFPCTARGRSEEWCLITHLRAWWNGPDVPILFSANTQLFAPPFVGISGIFFFAESARCGQSIPKCFHPPNWGIKFRPGLSSVLFFREDSLRLIMCFNGSFSLWCSHLRHVAEASCPQQLTTTFAP